MYPDQPAGNHLINAIGALVLGLADAIASGTEAAVGLSGGGPAALNALSEFLDGAPIGQLAGALGLTHSGAVRLVDRLVDAGLVERGPGPDGRSQAIRLTPAGQAARRMVAAARADAVTSVLSDLTPEERSALSSLVDSMLSSVTAQRIERRARGGNPGGWLCRLCDFGACGRSEGRCPSTSTAERWTTGRTADLGRTAEGGAAGRDRRPGPRR